MGGGGFGDGGGGGVESVLTDSAQTSPDSGCPTF